MIPFTVISATNGSTALVNGAITSLGGDIGGRDENTACYERRPQAEGDVRRQSAGGAQTRKMDDIMNSNGIMLGRMLPALTCSKAIKTPLFLKV